jgi:hypothetical protein
MNILPLANCRVVILREIPRLRRALGSRNLFVML